MATKGSNESVDAIMKELKSLGSEQIKKIFVNHGAREPLFGVKVEHLQKIRKRIKTDYQLALDLYATGNSDAMYLAGLIADDPKMTRKDLDRWAEQASAPVHCGFTVAWVAAGSPVGWDAALAWIDSPKEHIASAGWSALSSIVAIKPDAELDLAALKRLLARVKKTIHQAPNRARSAMNSFVIAVGSYVAPLTELAVKTGEEIGKVEVDVGDTSCKIPFAPDYIQKVKDRGSIGKKRKSAKC